MVVEGPLKKRSLQRKKEVPGGGETSAEAKIPEGLGALERNLRRSRQLRGSRNLGLGRCLGEGKLLQTKERVQTN